jgi:voltage-gated potassium channel
VTPHERLWQILVLLVVVVSFGTVGYQLIEGRAFFDSLYMTVITVASVGFQEVHPLSTAGRSFTIGLIIVGLGVVAYGLGTITAFWVEGDLSHLWEKRTMERQIAALRDHIVVCGGGETGRHVARELLRTRRPFVCVEIDPAQEDALRKLGPGIQERTGAVVFAMREGGTQRHIFNPPPEHVLEAGDVLMGCADHEQLGALQRIVTED